MSWAGIRDWFARDFDFYKKMLVVAGFFAILLLGLLGFQVSERGRLLAAIDGGWSDLKRLYITGNQIFSVNEELKRDALADAKADMTYYIAQKAFEAGLGSVDPRVTQGNPPAGAEDKAYTVTTPASMGEVFFDRERITRFLYLLENGTTRAKVTSVKLSPPIKGFVSGSRREDQWRYEVTITSRRRVEKK